MQLGNIVIGSCRNVKIIWMLLQNQLGIMVTISQKNNEIWGIL